MSTVQTLEPGSRHDLRVGISPDAPDEDQLKDERARSDIATPTKPRRATTGRAARRAVRLRCLLRCTYCHNPDTWHLKDGTYVSADHVLRRLGDFAPALRQPGGGLTISGGEPMVQLAFTRRDIRRREGIGSAHRHQTSGFLGDRADESYLSNIDLVLLDIKSSDPDTYRRVTGRDLAPRCASRNALLRCPSRSGSASPRPGETDDPANVDGIARFVAPMKNVEWVEVQPFHQMGPSSGRRWARLQALDTRRQPGPGESGHRTVPRAGCQHADDTHRSGRSTCWTLLARSSEASRY
jgi:pyruvate formate lyase activating enzyme